MAANNAQRVGAFLLALLFFVTTVAAAGYVVWELNRDDTSSEQSLETLEQQINETPQEDPVAEEQQQLANFEPPVTVDELRFDTITEGDGAVVQAGDIVTIHYTGALASNGIVFDSSVGRGEPAEFPLNNLIPGWQQGIPGMKVGETRRLFIPSALGYGEAGAGADIPPNSDLVFDIELFDTQSQSE